MGKNHEEYILDGLISLLTKDEARIVCYLSVPTLRLIVLLPMYVLVFALKRV